MSISRVEEDTPQPTMSVTDGTAAFSMFWGSTGGGRVRDWVYMGGPKVPLCGSESGETPRQSVSLPPASP